jgi:WhiB family redox-sensing transcriptional regulator
MYSDDPSDQAEAKALCARCPVAIRCALAAVRRHERFGTWGGFTAAEREALVKAVKRRAA